MKMLISCLDGRKTLCAMMTDENMASEETSYKLTNEDLDQLPLQQFNETIEVVDTLEAAAVAAQEMARETMLGFDTETRPSFKRGVTYKTALLQLSTEHKAWLIRINKIGLPDCIVSILENPNILKAGVAIRDDIKGLQKWHPFTPGNFTELQNLALEHGIEEFSLKKLAAHVMGIRISKRQRLSNWESSQLTMPQQNYAATDAWVGLMCYKGLVAGVCLHPRLLDILNSRK